MEAEEQEDRAGIWARPRNPRICVPRRVHLPKVQAVVWAVVQPANLARL